MDSIMKDNSFKKPVIYPKYNYHISLLELPFRIFVDIKISLNKPKNYLLNGTK